MQNMREHYDAVMRDLEGRIAHCEQEIHGYRDTLAQIRKLASEQPTLFADSPTVSAPL